MISTLDQLEARGLLRRVQDPADRRNKRVELTATGREVLATCQREIRAMEDDLLAALPAADRAALLRALLALHASEVVPR